MLVAPGPDTVTSEHATIVDVRPDDQTLIARSDDGRFVRLVGEQLDRGHLAHGYALTVHRAQGATVDVAHRFEDGGGRELAYVALSRARTASHAWVVADDVAQARDDLLREWSAEARARWAIDTSGPDPRPRRPWIWPGRVLDRAALEAERRALLSVIPPDPWPALRAAHHRLAALHQAEHDLPTAGGVWQHTDVGRAAQWLGDLRDDRNCCEQALRHDNLGWRERRRQRIQIERDAQFEESAAAEFERLAAPIRRWLEETRRAVEATTLSLRQRAAERNQWFAQHPEAEYRLEMLTAQLNAADQLPAETWPEHALTQPIEQAPVRLRAQAAEVDLGLDLGI